LCSSANAEFEEAFVKLRRAARVGGELRMNVWRRLADNLSVSNWRSGGDREPDKVSAVGDPAHSVQISNCYRVSVGEGQRRAAVQGGVAPCRVVVGLELGKLPLKITTIPEQHMVQAISFRRQSSRRAACGIPGASCRSGARRMGAKRHVRDRFDFVDLQNPQVRPPPVGLEERIVIRTEMSWYALSMNCRVEQAADVGTREGAAAHADADESTRELVHDHEHPVASEHDGLAAK
jgi:hypothetical protein